MATLYRLVFKSEILDIKACIRLRLHNAICLSNSFCYVKWLYEFQSDQTELACLNRIVADKLHHVILGFCDKFCCYTVRVGTMYCQPEEKAIWC